MRGGISDLSLTCPKRCQVSKPMQFVYSTTMVCLQGFTMKVQVYKRLYHNGLTGFFLKTQVQICSNLHLIFYCFLEACKFEGPISCNTSSRHTTTPNKHSSSFQQALDHMSQPSIYMLNATSMHAS